jgi:hypothetical protein
VIYATPLTFRQYVRTLSVGLSDSNAKLSSDYMVPALRRDRTDNHEVLIMIAKTMASNLVSVYSGQNCLGHVLRRPRLGYEAYNRDDKPIGTFATQREAADALTDAAERSS